MTPPASLLGHMLHVGGGCEFSHGSGADSLKGHPVFARDRVPVRPSLRGRAVNRHPHTAKVTDQRCSPVRANNLLVRSHHAPEIEHIMCYLQAQNVVRPF